LNDWPKPSLIALKILTWTSIWDYHISLPSTCESIHSKWLHTDRQPQIHLIFRCYLFTFSASTRFPTIAIKKAAGTRPYSTTTAPPDPIAYSRRSHICTHTHLTTYREINRNGPVIRSGNVACGEKRDGGSEGPQPAFVPVLLPNCGLCHGDVGVSCSAASAIAGLSTKDTLYRLCRRSWPTQRLVTRPQPRGAPKGVQSFGDAVSG